MKVYDPGHIYSLRCLDGQAEEILKFVKRCNPPEKYPGNTSSYPGTTIQEVCRALIDRLIFVNHQSEILTGEPCWQDVKAIEKARDIIWLLEHRAAARHDMKLPDRVPEIEKVPTCKKCGHIVCLHQEAA